MKNFLAKKVTRVKIQPSCSSISSGVLKTVIKTEEKEEIEIEMKMVENDDSLLKLRQIQTAQVIELERIGIPQNGCVSIFIDGKEIGMCNVNIIS